MKCPQNCNKASLLTAVDELNEIGAKLQVKSGSMVVRINKVAEKIGEMNHFEIIEALSDSALAELTAWGIVSDFIKEDDVEDGLQKTLDLIEKDPDAYYQADEVITFDESFLPERPEWAKWEDAIASGDLSKKKVKKMQAKIDACKAEKEKTDAEHDKKAEAKARKDKAKDDVKNKDPKPSKEEQDLAQEIATLTGSLEGAKKKRAKKIQNRIAKLEAQLKNLQETEATPKEKKKKKAPKKSGPGVILSIITILKESKKFMTHEEVCEGLSEIITDKEPEEFLKTVKAQLGAKSPTRIEQEKGVEIEFKNNETIAKRKYKYISGGK